MKTCVHRFLLFFNIQILVVSVFFVTGCEIDDPYASYTFTPKSPTQILNGNFYWADWLDNETILLWFTGSEIRQYNITTKTESTFYTLEELPTKDYYSNPVLLNENNLLLMTLSKQTTDPWGNLIQNTYLHITNFETSEARTLDIPIAYGTIVSAFPNIAYPSYNEYGMQETLIYNYETEEYKNIGPGYPVAFSPDGEELLYFNANEYTHYIHNLTEGSNTQFSYYVDSNGIAQIYWTDAGIFEFRDTYQENGQVITLRNVLTNSILLSRPTITIGLHPSPSATSFLFGEVHCQSPYVQYCSEGTYVSLKIASTAGPDRELMTEAAYYESSILITKAKFSPNEEKIVFIRSNLAYLIENQN